METELPNLATLGLQVIAAVVSAVILPTIPLAYKLLKAYFDAKIASIKDAEKRALAEFAFKRLDFIVNNVVDEITQTTDKTTGLSEEEKKYRKGLALSRIKSQLTEANEAVLREEVKDFDRYLLTKIEASRFFQKTLDQKDT